MGLFKWDSKLLEAVQFMKKHMMALATIFTLCTGAFTTNAFAAEHKIEKGETLSEISEQYSMNVEDLKNLNDLSSDLIIANEILSVLDESDFYSIQKGDTLFEIGQAKKATVEQLMEWNNLSTEIIFAGDILAVTVEAGKQLMNEQATQSAELKTNKETKTENQEKEADNQLIDNRKFEKSAFATFDEAWQHFNESPICLKIKKSVKGKDIMIKSVAQYPQIKMSEMDFINLVHAANASFGDFSLRLLSTYPDLTAGDVRHCTLVLLGMNDAEIAALEGVSYSGTTAAFR